MLAPLALVGWGAFVARPTAKRTAHQHAAMGGTEQDANACVVDQDCREAMPQVRTIMR